MLYLKKTFDYEYGVEEADVVLLGIPFDSTQIGSSVKHGPLFIRDAIRNLPGYDPELKINIFEKLKIADIGDIEVVPGNWKLTNKRITDTVKWIFEKNPKAFPVSLGGEHLITLGILQAFQQKKITVIDFDAHRDLMPQWLGEDFSHITWAHHLLKDPRFELVQIGCRSWYKEEEKFLSKVEDKIEKTRNPVYLTVDLDVLDPAFAPEVGTTEPLGMSPAELLKNLRAVCKNKVMGMDIVECSSQRTGTQTASMGANIFKKTLGYMVKEGML